MRILIVAPGPYFSVRDVYTGWANGLVEAGAQVARYNLDERLQFYSTAMVPVEGGEPRNAFDRNTAAQRACDGILSQVYQLQPDVVLVISSFFVPGDLLDLLRARGVKVVVIHTEEPYECDRELQVAVHADLNIINDPTHLALFERLASTYYQPHCYRPDFHRPARGQVHPDTISDVVFVGTGYESRINYLEAVDWTGLDVALAGNWTALTETSPLRKFLAHDIAICVDNSETSDLYRGAKVSFNLYRKEANKPELSAGWAMGPREVEMAATGLFFLRDPRGESDKILPMLPILDAPEDLGALLRWWVDHEPQRIEAATAARAAVADRTFVNAARALLHRLDA